MDQPKLLSTPSLLTCFQKIENTAPQIPESQEKCTLKFPDGREVQLPLLKGSDETNFIDIRNLFNLTGCFTFDPGFACTGSCASTITHIDGEKGQLWHRGYKIEDLANNCSYMEVCYLLIYGELPSNEELKIFEDTVVSEMLVHEQLVSFYKGFKTGAHPMAIMTGVVGALSAFMHEEINVFDPRTREFTALKLIAKIPTIAAISYRTAMGLPIVYPKKEYSYIENFLYMMFANPMEPFNIDKTIVRAIDVICILHADHEQNASTSTVRIAGSSLANPYACIAAGIASLWGPSHGGANEKVIHMLEEIKSVDRIPEYIAKAKDKTANQRLMGFGHRIYKNFDPRAKIMQKMCHEVLEKLGDKEAQPLFQIAVKLEEIALKDQYFISRKLYPNVDFYTGIVFKAIGIPLEMFTVMFAMARCVGWISQWNEMFSEKGGIRIGRPRQIYVGAKEREIIDIKKREKEERSRVIAIPKLNKFTNLMKL